MNAVAFALLCVGVASGILSLVMLYLLATQGAFL